MTEGCEAASFDLHDSVDVQCRGMLSLGNTSSTRWIPWGAGRMSRHGSVGAACRQVGACCQLKNDLQALSIRQFQDCMTITIPYEHIHTVMFWDTKHAAKRLISTAHAACALRFDLAALLRTFGAENKVSEFLKNSWAVLNKSSRLTDL